jgi:hypothetical protein
MTQTNFDPAQAIVLADVPAASTTVSGIVELATDAEVSTWTDTTRAVTPSQIDNYAVGTQLKSLFHTFQIITAGFAGTTRAPWWTGATQTWTVSTAGYAEIITSGGSPMWFTGSGWLPWTWSQNNYRYTDWKDLRVKFKCKFLWWQESVWLNTVANGDFWQVETSIIDGNIRLCWNSWNLYACTSNGSAYTAVAITGITYTDWNTYEIITNPWVDVKFYVNGVLKATITTNIPTWTGIVNFWVSNNNSNATRLSPITVSIEN